MSLFNSLGNGNPQQNQQQIYQNFRNDPAGFMKDHGINVPQGVNMQDPGAILNSLMQSGQINNQRYQQALQMMRMMGYK